MPRFVVTGTVTVEVIVEIEAANEDAARQLFSNHVSASASIDDDVKTKAKATMIGDFDVNVEINDIDQATDVEESDDGDTEDK